MGDVHRSHGESGAVDYATDIAVELDVVDVERSGLDLEGVFLVGIAQFNDVPMPEHGVVVYVDLGVHCQHAAVGSDAEWIDLDERAVVLFKQLVQGGHQSRDWPVQGVGNTESVRELASLERLQAEHRVYGDGENLLRCGLGHLLDLHAARRTGDRHYTLGSAIDSHPDVHFGLDVDRLLHEYAADGDSFWSGLKRDECRSEHRLGRFGCCLRRVDNLDAASLAASAGVDLGLHDDGPADVSCDLGGFVRGGRDLPLGYGDAVSCEDFFRLVFVDLHKLAPCGGCPQDIVAQGVYG